MYPQVLRELLAVTATPVLIICEISWHLGKIPEDWKTENITSVFKKERNEFLGNYTPVSLA